MQTKDKKKTRKKKKKKAKKEKEKKRKNLIPRTRQSKCGRLCIFSVNVIGRDIFNYTPQTFQIEIEVSVTNSYNISI
jgi:hypothetical protein